MLKDLPVWHYVTFDSAIGYDSIVRLRDELLAARSCGALAFGHIVIGVRTGRSVRDGNLHGRIETDKDDGKIVLGIGFEDLASLDIYYAAPTHATIRRRHYESYAPEIAELYARTDREPENSREIYGEIERAVTHFMRRDDFVFTTDGS
ncbi:MAG: hypothetical protein BVN33_04095 [Proteobacteria bacterium ST_bin13]|nr:MAG: hypothetical protein BVN33_04095 [Proteobacteria bacterium ST_bin13]